MPLKQRPNPTARRRRPAPACKHLQLTFKSSPLAVANGCVQYTQQRLFTAATGKRKRSSDGIASETDFPAPIGLPDDEIVMCPKYPPQSLRAWESLPGRNGVTKRRGVIYVASPPAETGVERMTVTTNVPEDISYTVSPDVGEIIEYLKAFYHGVEVMQLPEKLSWVPWEPSSQTQSPARPQAMGLQTSKEIIRVRMRYGNKIKGSIEESTLRDLFSYQVNQLDLLDVAASILPKDAYALILVVKQDMYEDDDDDFCCGRAFGGSRIAVVSTARYDPVLDEIQGVDREHEWPSSHCAAFIAKACGEKMESTRQKTKNSSPGKDQGNVDAVDSEHEGALQLAVKSHLAISPSGFNAHTTYLLRVCRTASHEIGHCVGMDHCMYYACVMQGTASLKEDNRQPPYACPVCEAKIGRAVEGLLAERWGSISTWKLARHQAIREFCDERKGAFEPLLAWTREVLSQTVR